VKIRNMMYLAMALVILWMIALLSMPAGEGQGFVWNLGLLLIILGLGLIAQWLWWLYTSNDLLWPSGRTSLRSQSETDVAILPRIVYTDEEGKPKTSTRSTEFLVFFGGLHRFSVRFTAPREVFFVNRDVLMVDRGDLVHNLIRSQPFIYRNVPNRAVGERSKSRLPMEFKRILAKWNVPDGVPVYVAWEPIGLKLQDDVYKEALAYQEWYETTNEAYDHALEIKGKSEAAAHHTASAHEAATRAFAKEARGPKSFADRVASITKKDEDEE
jgi:hypothetical protein